MTHCILPLFRVRLVWLFEVEGQNGSKNHQQTNSQQTVPKLIITITAGSVDWLSHYVGWQLVLMPLLARWVPSPFFQGLKCHSNLKDFFTNGLTRHNLGSRSRATVGFSASARTTFQFFCTVTKLNRPNENRNCSAKIETVRMQIVTHPDRKW